MQQECFSFRRFFVLPAVEQEHPGHKTPKAKPPQDPQISSLEERLMQSLGTKVHLKHRSNKKGGSIEVEYFSLEELDRLLELLIQ